MAISSIILLAATATLAPAAASAALAPLATTAVIAPVAASAGDRVIRFTAATEPDRHAVLLVHGWLSTALPEGEARPGFAQSPFTRAVHWRDGSGAPVGRGMNASLQQRLEAQDGVAVYAFDYSANSSGWVGDNGSADNLARAIRSIASSVGGKVDIVTHSMGGLALRYALADSPDLVDLLGQVVTVGTPTEGSDIANVAVGIAATIRNMMSSMPVLQNLVLPGIGAACNAQLSTDARAGCDMPPVIRTGIAALGEGGIALRAGSPELADLPDWPSAVSVHAIAGSASITVPLIAGVSFDIELGDGLVGESSANAEADDTTVVSCRTELEPGIAGLLSVLRGEVEAPPYGGACGHDALFANLEVVDAVLDALETPDRSDLVADPAGVAGTASAVGSRGAGARG